MAGTKRRESGGSNKSSGKKARKTEAGQSPKQAAAKSPTTSPKSSPKSSPKKSSPKSSPKLSPKLSPTLHVASSPKTSPKSSPKTSPKLSPKLSAQGSPKKSFSPLAAPSSPPAKMKNDPYLLEEAEYIKKDERWRNKQRTLVLCSRGTTSLFRHVMVDLRRLMPHCKHESKFEKKCSFRELTEVCELKSCNNCVYFEARKMKDLYLWVARLPNGPSMKFQVLNVHSLGEIRYSGNCLLGSRPLLSFDKSFDEVPYLTVLKELFTQAFGTPRNHPKQKPFIDHVMSFYHSDGKIFFRHYQISPQTEDTLDDPEKQALTEIGPRFVLDPIKMLSGAFTGECIYENNQFMSPTALRIAAKAAMGSKYANRVVAKSGREAFEEEHQIGEDGLDDVFGD